MERPAGDRLQGKIRLVIGRANAGSISAAACLDGGYNIMSGAVHA